MNSKLPALIPVTGSSFPVEVETRKQFWLANPKPASVRRWPNPKPFAFTLWGFVVDSYGSIVDGYDIDLMEVSDVAPTFEEFVRLHNAALKGFGNTVLRDYVSGSRALPGTGSGSDLAVATDSTAFSSHRFRGLLMMPPL